MKTKMPLISRKASLRRQIGMLLGGVACSVAVHGVAAAQEAKRPAALEDVIVTATKRDVSLQDVAGSVSAMTGDQLQQMGAQSLSDYVNKMPGVQFNDYQPGVSEVIMRGVSATTYHEQGQTVVGYYINEIPLAEAGWPVVIPDIDTFDLNRVEVLRGPQGTLFGAAALGGLVNYVANEADPSGFDGAVESSVGQTENANPDMNYSIKGMLNMPLSDDKLALRVVALQRFDAGFLDNINTGKKGTNDLTTTGARMSMVWQPSEGTKVSLLALYQKMELEDQSYQLIDGTYDRATYIFEPHDTELELYSLRLDQDVGFAELTVLGAIANKDGKPVFDSSDVGYLQGNFLPTPSRSHVASDAYHVEARLASKGEGRFSWLFGAAYYESDKSTNDVTYQAGAAAFIDANPANFGGNPGSLLAPDDNFSRYIAKQTNKDLGIFGEVSFDITSTLTATVGGRYYDLSSDATVTRPPSALFLDSFDAVGSEFTQDQSEDGFTPKASLSWRPNDNFMVYGLYSQGFRVGGASPNPPGLVGVPPSYDSDTVDNYELGIRSSLADNSVQLDVTAFHIDWSNMQVRLFTPAPFYYSYVSNAGAADVDGVELALGWRAPRVFDLQASVTWEDARVSSFVEDTFAPGGGHPAGTTLPGSSEWVTSVTAGFNFDSVPWAPRFEISDRYMSEAPVAWESINERGGFSIVDMRLSVQPTEKMSVSLFMNNVLDEYGTLNAPFADFYVVPLGTVTRPRTYGLRLNYDF